MSKDAPTAACPICRKTLPEPAPLTPFCSEKCRLVDLAQWLDGAYRLPDNSQSPSMDDENEG